MSKLQNNLRSVSLKEDKPEKSKMYCNINYDIAERVRDFKYHKGMRLDRAMEELFTLGLKAYEKKYEEIPRRPLSVIQSGKKRGEQISKTKTNNNQ